MADKDSKNKKKLQKDDIRTFIRVISYAKPYAWRLIIGAACTVIGGGSIIAMFITAQALLSDIFSINNKLFGDGAKEQAVVEEVVEAPVQAKAEEIVAETTASDEPAIVKDMSKKLMGKFIDSENMKQLEEAGLSGMLKVCGMLMICIIVNSLGVFGSMYYLQWVGQRVVMDLRIGVFNHLQKLPIAFYNSSKSGDMIARTVTDTQQLQNMVSNVITDLIRQPIMLVMVLSYILITEWRLALFSVIFFPTCVIPISIIGKRVRRISREGQKRMADLTSVMKEALDGVTVVKSYGQEAREEARFAEQCKGFFRRMVSATKAKAFNDPISHTVGGLGGIGVLLYAMINKTPFEECILFAAAIWALYEPVKKLGKISMEIQQSSASADRIFEIIDTPITVSNKPDAKPISTPLEALTFENVEFGYDDKQVFSSLNLELKAGQSLAVVGPSGGGKSTIVSLLMRFFDPVSGAVKRNGIDIRDFTIESIRENIGLVMQDNFLFNDTIAANIAYGKSGATQEEIEAAAKLAHAHDFIMGKEDGYNTMVGERGVSLSGGQKQRIAIARALIRKPSLLILDEATSALDTESERIVQNAIDDLFGKITIIIIAHRLSTIAKCDRVAVVANGVVAEYGTQEELLALGGVYTKLHEMQFGKN
ncbi:MAG: ABC transporter ATP-binding protein [Kiritimatiellae bacterium]|nr:ABC transporter ATP-binding protein [Kiritimatiellia bacterium]